MTSRNEVATPPAKRSCDIDIPGAAKRWGVSERFVRRLVEERRIPFHKIGRLVRFDEADLDAFAAARRVEPWDAA